MLHAEHMMVSMNVRGRHMIRYRGTWACPHLQRVEQASGQPRRNSAQCALLARHYHCCERPVGAVGRVALIDCDPQKMFSVNLSVLRHNHGITGQFCACMRNGITGQNLQRS